jgi:hypothetical protein
MCDEHLFLIKNNTWVLTDLFTLPELVFCKWVYKIKTTYTWEIIKYKARIVTQGFIETYQVDYDQLLVQL